MTNRWIAGACVLGAIALLGICCVKQDGGSKLSTLATTQAEPTTRPALRLTSTEATTPDVGAAPTLLEGYALAHPDEQLALPRILAEVSGVTDISDVEVACVQDESGTVFIYDLAKREITRTIPFGPDGDYEGLTRVGGTLYVLRSDGTLFEIDGFADSHPKTTSVDLGLPTRDNEGLCFDPVQSRLLVSPKSRPGKAEDEKLTQVLFEYDPKSRSLGAMPVVTLDLADVFDGRERQRETRRGKKRVMPSRFLPSSVAVHPKTGNYFVISAVAHNLVVFDRQGKAKSQFPLSPALFPQPEGVTFLPSGELVITNEGVNGKPTLLRFKPRL